MYTSFPMFPFPICLSASHPATYLKLDWQHILQCELLSAYIHEHIRNVPLLFVQYIGCSNPETSSAGLLDGVHLL